MIRYGIDIEDTAVIFVILASGVENWVRPIATKCIARTMQSDQNTKIQQERNLANFRMTVLAPKRKLSTSSERMPSMTPIRFRYASSASASPGA
jgi:hypothetical protein